MNEGINELIDVTVTEGQGQDGSDVASPFCGHKVYMKISEDLTSPQLNINQT